MRSTFIKSLEKFAEEDDSLFLLTGDLGFRLFDRFRDAYPQRFIDAGVAEANMIGVAAGLALSGKNVYCYSIATFLTTRCLEQIRIDLCYQNLNVKLVGVGAGWSYGLEGMTHHAIEDISIMKSLPNMTVVAPGDPLEAEAVIAESVIYKGPLYIRLGKDNDPQVHKSIPNFKIGKGMIIDKGRDLTIIATGTMLHATKTALGILASKGLRATLISMHTIKPLDVELIEECAKDSKAIFTIEEHSITGGLGSSVAETLIELNYKGLFRKIGLPDKYGPDIGGRDYLQQKHHLTPAAIATRILTECNPNLGEITVESQSSLRELSSSLSQHGKFGLRKIKFVDPAANYRMIKSEIDQAYFEVMSKGDLIDRGHLKNFEENLAKFVGTRYAVGLNSGYDALHISLRAAGIGPGDEVIVPAHTFVATCSAVVNVGATPVLVDVAKDFNIDVDKIEAAITDRTRCLLPVHLSGYMADMPRIMALAKKYDLVVVEDACQSLGSSINGKGGGSWGLTGSWSFYPFKILGGYGDGGAITTDDEEVAIFARRMRYNGEDRKTGEYYGHGFTCLLDNLQAAFLDVKLRHLPNWIVRRKDIAERYRKALQDIPDLLLPHYGKPGFDHVYQNYTVRSKQGNAFSDYLECNGVEVLTQFRKPYYKHEALKLIDRGFPETEAISREVCSLPMNVEITDDEIDYVIQVVLSFYGK